MHDVLREREERVEVDELLQQAEADRDGADVLPDRAAFFCWVFVLCWLFLLLVFKGGKGESGQKHTHRQARLINNNK